MEQTLEYLSCGKFQYCNICFRRLKILYNSCLVCLWKKKTCHMEMWKCCYQSLCGCYSFGNDSPISSIHHASWGVTLLLNVWLSKFIIFPLLSDSSNRYHTSAPAAPSLLQVKQTGSHIFSDVLPNFECVMFCIFAGSDSTAQQVSLIAVYLQCCLLHLVLMTDQKGRELHNFLAKGRGMKMEGKI